MRHGATINPAWFVDGARVLGACGGDFVRFWDVQTGKPLNSVAGIEGPADGKVVVARGEKSPTLIDGVLQADSAIRLRSPSCFHPSQLRVYTPSPSVARTVFRSVVFCGVLVSVALSTRPSSQGRQVGG